MSRRLLYGLTAIGVGFASGWALNAVHRWQETPQTSRASKSREEPRPSASVPSTTIEPRPGSVLAGDPPPRAREALAPAAPPPPATPPLVASPEKSPPEVAARGKLKKARKGKRYRDDDD
jgi:hypothetical protein